VYEKSGHIENANFRRCGLPFNSIRNPKIPFSVRPAADGPDRAGAAVIRLNEALKSFPTSARLWWRWGSQFEMNKTYESGSSLQSRHRIRPKFAQAYACLGMTRVDFGQYGEQSDYTSKRCKEA